MMARAFVMRGLGFALIWWALAEGRSDSWGLGLATVAVAVATSLVLSPPGRGRFSLPGVLAFAGFFLVQSVRGGVLVARQALRRRPDLAPALIQLPTTLPPGPATVLLANTLNLLPGTVALDVEGKTLRVHVLDSRLPIAEEVAAVEIHIARMFGISP